MDELFLAKVSAAALPRSALEAAFNANLITDGLASRILGRSEVSRSANNAGKVQAATVAAGAEPDLLTVLEQELGHLAGWDDADFTTFALRRAVQGKRRSRS